MKSFVKIWILFLLFCFMGCSKKSDSDPDVYLSIEEDGLFKDLNLGFSGFRSGSQVDIYWSVFRPTEYGSNHLDRTTAHHIMEQYNGKDLSFRIFPWEDIVLGYATEYLFCIEVVGRSASRDADVYGYWNFRIKSTLSPKMNHIDFSNDEVHLSGTIVMDRYSDQIIEHGFYVGFEALSSALSPDPVEIREKFEKIALDQPYTDFGTTLQNWIPTSSWIYAYAYAKTAFGEIISLGSTRALYEARVFVSTSSNFTELTHERGTVYGSASFEKEQSLFSIVERGFCYLNTHVVTSGRMPSINDGRLILEGGEGEFSGTIRGLSPGAAYKVRAYAINSLDQIFYANDYVTLAMFSTEPFQPYCKIKNYYTDDPNVTGVVVLEGSVDSDQGYPVTERGFCYTKSGNSPTVNDHKIPLGSGLGTFTTTLTDLSPGTYTFKAYAINEAGLKYSWGFYQLTLK